MPGVCKSAFGMGDAGGCYKKQMGIECILDVRGLEQPEPLLRARDLFT